MTDHLSPWAMYVGMILTFELKVTIQFLLNFIHFVHCRSFRVDSRADLVRGTGTCFPLKQNLELLTKPEHFRRT